MSSDLRLLGFATGVKDSNFKSTTVSYSKHVDDTRAKNWSSVRYADSGCMTIWFCHFHHYKKHGFLLNIPVLSLRCHNTHLPASKCLLLPEIHFGSVTSFKDRALERGTLLQILLQLWWLTLNRRLKFMYSPCHTLDPALLICRSGKSNSPFSKADRTLNHQTFETLWAKSVSSCFVIAEG